MDEPLSPTFSCYGLARQKYKKTDTCVYFSSLFLVLIKKDVKFVEK